MAFVCRLVCRLKDSNAILSRGLELTVPRVSQAEDGNSMPLWTSPMEDFSSILTPK